MNSPWGMHYQIIKETGWTWHYMLWKISKANIMLALSDAPRFKRQEADAIQADGAFLNSKLKHQS